MTKINLIPPEIKKKKRAPRGAPGGPSLAWLLFIIPLVVLILMVFLYVQGNNKARDQKTALKEKQAELADWQAKNAQLAKYQARQQEIASTEAMAISALKGRVYWARILNEIAIMIPKDVWLTSLTGTSTATGGSVTFEATVLQCPNRLGKAGSEWPYLPDYQPVAGWLERMAQIVEFQRVWLSSAQPAQIQSGTPTTETEATVDTWVIKFSSQATLNMQTATIGGLAPAAGSTPTVPGSAPSPSSAPSSSPGR